MGNLTALKVKALRKPGRFGDCSGLYLVVRPSGPSWTVGSTIFEMWLGRM